MSYPPSQGPPPSAPGYGPPQAQGYPQQAGYATPNQGYPAPAQPGYNYGQPPVSQGYGQPPPQAYGQPPPQAYAPQQLAGQMGGMSLQGPPRAGDSFIMAKLTEGYVVILQSQASGKSLRINNGNVQGIGENGSLAQFRVHVKRPGVVAFQNVGIPDNWLAIYQGKTIGTGKGDPYCEFTVGEIDGKVVLESSQYPGQYVGILPNGTVKPPESTKTGPHGRFTVTVLSGPPPPAQPSPPTQHPPPAQYPQAQGGYYPALPPQQGPTAPPQPQYQPQPSPPQPQMPGIQAAGAQSPTGYNVMDAFQGGNLVQLIAKNNGNPLSVANGSLNTRPSALGVTDSVWTVLVPSGSAPGIMVLQNVKWPGMHIAINKKGKVESGQGKKWCQLFPRARSDNYVCFMSVENQGQFLGFGDNGNPLDAKNVGEGDRDAHFFVRIEKQKHGNSAQIMTPFGKPSLANQLSDGSIIQLYLKSNNNYLSINANGIVQNTMNGNDPHTFFKLADRGMGIVSLNTYKYPGFRLKVQGGALIGKGSADIGSDFRLKECADGTVSFESVIMSSTYVGISGPAGFARNLNVFLVVIQRFGGSETTTKNPLN